VTEKESIGKIWMKIFWSKVCFKVGELMMELFKSDRKAARETLKRACSRNSGNA
jgi:hypothetical protein